jgi:hypothetical protein
VHSYDVASMMGVALCGGAAGGDRERRAGDGHGGCRPRRGGQHGRAVQVDPIKLTLKAPGSKHLKLEHNILLPHLVFNFNSRLYNMAAVRLVQVPGIAVDVDFKHHPVYATVLARCGPPDIARHVICSFSFSFIEPQGASHVIATS